MTKFFEPISASATHIYHSALELCPTSSIVRRFNYDRTDRIARLPRVVVGASYSWDPSLSISGKDDYQFCTWSPCGRFVAALTGNAVEIRNQLTFELVTTLQPMDTIPLPLLAGPLAYSPDGRSLACASYTSIVVWDIQTGGVAKEIVCSGKAISLVWSLDGRTIGTLEYLPPRTGHIGTHVNTYDVVSGTPTFFANIRSYHQPLLWAFETSFRVLTTERHPLDHAKIETQIQISVVQPPLTTIRRWSITTEAQAKDTSTDHTPGSKVVSFSPAACRIAIFAGGKLLIFQDRSPVPLLEEEGHFLSPCFSPDGSLFAASKDEIVYTWRYPSCCYVRWAEFRCQGYINSLHFSPTSSAFLSHSGNILKILNSEGLPNNYEFHRRQHAAISHSGCRIASHKPKNFVEITDPHSTSPSQSIHTQVQIDGLLISGNVLLVIGSGQVVAWLLEKEGLASGDRRFKDDDHIWAVSLTPPDHGDKTLPTSLLQPKPKLKFHVEGQIGVIDRGEIGLFFYNTETGEVLPSTQTPLSLSGPGYDPSDRLCGRHHRHYHNLSQHHTPPRGSWYPSETALREGWVRDPEGRHRLWLHVEWRKSWDLADWCHNITTQFGIVGGLPVVVKF